jgi:membrane-bound lytic murein transglycosylase D
MNSKSGIGRLAVAWVVAALLGVVVEPVFGQQPQKPNVPDSQSIIDRAEESFRRGEEAKAKGLTEVARKLFDSALEIVHQSGIDLKTDSRLDAYYRRLIERIHKLEVPNAARDAAGDAAKHEAEQKPEVSEPSGLDEIADIKEDELSATTPEGIKIFGSYDFDFTVAPPVTQFINFFTAGRGRSTMTVGLQRSGRYREMAEKIFKEEKVPVDLIWLAQAESVWKPAALSRAAAKGIWQFIPSTGIRFGLAQTTWIDERSNPEKSTRAAARYLKWLHNHFAGDWLLAMAAYNSGENRVDSAIARCGYADFWELYRRGLLPRETRNYVPSILSIVIISKNQKRYGFDVRPDIPLNYDTFELPAQTDLKVTADLLGIPYEVMQDLNPELRRGTSPAGTRYTIKLPKGMKKQFEVAYAALPEEKRVGPKLVLPVEEIAQSRRSSYRTRGASYRVRRGDTLSSIAKRSGVTVQELARVNRMSSRGELRNGQTIRIPKTIKSSRSRTTRLTARKRR